MLCDGVRFELTSVLTTTPFLPLNYPPLCMRAHLRPWWREGELNPIPFPFKHRFRTQTTVCDNAHLRSLATPLSVGCSPDATISPLMYRGWFAPPLISLTQGGSRLPFYRLLLPHHLSRTSFSRLQTLSVTRFPCRLPT